MADGLSRLCNNREQPATINLLYTYAALDTAVDDEFQFEERSRTYLGLKLTRTNIKKMT